MSFFMLLSSPDSTHFHVARSGESQNIKLRSVIHYCLKEKITSGEELIFNSIKSKMIDSYKGTRDALISDIFGLEVIRLARIAALAKGPFHLLTKDFVCKLVKLGPDLAEEAEVISSALTEWNKTYEGPVVIDPTPIPIPFLKGFEKEDFKDTPTLKKPYFVWEFTFKNHKNEVHSI